MEKPDLLLLIDTLNNDLSTETRASTAEALGEFEEQAAVDILIDTLLRAYLNRNDKCCKPLLE